MAVKQFQARNDLVVEGYLGPSTRIIIEESDARPNSPTGGKVTKSLFGLSIS
jgi:peptidoglycan hydrolase-like protein with peptidoglycan-binding domain